MVRRGSTVRVRQNALVKYLQISTLLLSARRTHDRVPDTSAVLATQRDVSRRLLTRRHRPARTRQPGKLAAKKERPLSEQGDPDPFSRGRGSVSGTSGGLSEGSPRCRGRRLVPTSVRGVVLFAGDDQQRAALLVLRVDLGLSPRIRLLRRLRSRFCVKECLARLRRPPSLPGLVELGVHQLLPFSAEEQRSNRSSRFGPRFYRPELARCARGAAARPAR